MEQQAWLRLKEAFHETCDLARPEQEMRLDAVCASNRFLRHAVEQLLAFDQEPGGVLREDGGPTVSDCAFAPGDVVANRFEIQRFIAKGGMGEVYRAHDRHLHCLVALKTILPDLAHSLGIQERFKREIRLARQIGHRNVCRIYDLVPDNADNPKFFFFSMELLEGETLAEYLKRRGRLSFEEALPLVQQMAAGLSALHEQGVVHRDFKPANVFLVPKPSGELQVKITDFGLACSLPGSGGDAPTISGPGDRAGTPRYMAPEQLDGKQVAPSTDIYALGLVMYEMATGKHAYSATSLGENAVQKQRPPRPPRDHVKGLPARWDDTILHCVQPRPEERPTNVLDVAAALEAEGLPGWVVRLRRQAKRLRAVLKHRWFVLVPVGLMIVLAVSLLFWPSPTQKHLAIIPFQNLTGDPEQQRFCDGLAYLAASRLSRVQQFQNRLLVVPANDVFGNEVATVADASRVFDVNMAITGSMQMVGDRYRVTVNLVDVGTERLLDAAEPVEITLADPGSAQDQIIAAVVQLLKLQISPQAQQVLRATTSDSNRAESLYVEALGLLSRFEKKGNLDQAIDLFSEALEIDPAYAVAVAGRAEARLRKFDATRDIQDLSMAESNAQRAVEMDETLPEPWVTLGMVHREKGQLGDATEAFNRALREDSSYPMAYRELGTAYREQGRCSKAEKAYRRGMKLLTNDDWRFHQSLGVLHAKCGEYEKAEKEFKQVITLVRDSNRGYLALSAVYSRMGKYKEALEQVEKALELDPHPRIYDNKASILIYQRRFREAERTMRELTSGGSATYISWGNLGDALRYGPGSDIEAQQAYERAAELVNKRLNVNPTDGAMLVQLAAFEAKLDACPSAIERLEKVAGTVKRKPEIRGKAATVYAACNKPDEALDALEKALETGYSIAFVKDDPDLSPLRENSRYLYLVRSYSTRRQRN